MSIATPARVGGSTNAAGAIDLDTLTLRTVMVPLNQAVGLSCTATCGDAEALSRDSGRSRLVVSAAGRPVGIAHVRDVVRTSPSMPIALSIMRAERAQLVLVVDATGAIGLVSMEDLLERVLGQFDDETDHR